jgi:hypothetical protein
MGILNYLYNYTGMVKGGRNCSIFLTTTTPPAAATTTTTTTTAAAAAGWYSVLSTAIQYALNGLWVKSRKSEIFRSCPDQSWGPPSILYNGCIILPRYKAARACINPSLASRLKKEYSHNSTLSVPSWTVVGWTVPVPENCTCTTAVTFTVIPENW